MAEAKIGKEVIVVRDTNAAALHAKIGTLERYKRFRTEFLQLMGRVPGVMYDQGTQCLSFLVSSRVLKMRFTVVLKVSGWYPWCRVVVRGVKVDFGVGEEEALGRVKEIAASVEIGERWLTRFLDRVLDDFRIV
jgi:hypothetical protein